MVFTLFLEVENEYLRKVFGCLRKKQISRINAYYIMYITLLDSLFLLASEVEVEWRYSFERLEKGNQSSFPRFCDFL